MTMDDDEQMDSVDRFSARAGEYMRHRPEYPQAALDFLEEQDYLGMGTKVADVGSGTSIFTRQLIGKGCEVWAVEPNAAMRTLAETQLGERAMFHSVPADAEDTRLDDGSVELVTAAQAFHWFDAEAAREEFSRILQSPKRVAFLWNIRDREGSPFMEALEDVIRTHGENYDEIVGGYERHVEKLEAFFGGTRAEGAFDHRTFEHSQTVDEHGLLGLVTSFSYMPRPNDEGFDAMVEALREVFADHAEAGSVEIQYLTELYYGTLP